MTTKRMLTLHISDETVALIEEKLGIAVMDLTRWVLDGGDVLPAATLEWLSTSLTDLVAAHDELCRAWSDAEVAAS